MISPQKQKMLVKEPQTFVTMVDEKELSRVPATEVVDFTAFKADVDNMGLALSAERFAGPSSGGYALAHWQVSKTPAAFFVVHPIVAVTMFDGDGVMFNPTFEGIGEPVEMREGCLSHPYRGTRKVKRYEKITAQYRNQNGEEKVMALDGIAAEIYQHETQHCGGSSVWLDKVII